MMMRSHSDDGREETEQASRRPKTSPCAGTLIFVPYASNVYCASGLGQCFPGRDPLADYYRQHA